MPTSAPQKVSIAALRAVQGIIELEDGSEHPVLPITGEAFDLVQSADEAETSARTKMDALFTAAHCCVPSLTPAQVRALTIEQVQAIIQIASGQIAAVQALVPNSPRTAEKPRRRSS